MLPTSNDSLLFLQSGPDTVYRNNCLPYAVMLFLLALLQIFLLTAPAHATTVSSFMVTRAYGAPLSIAGATAQVQTEAQLQAHAYLLRKLVQEPAIRHINTVTTTFSPPDINGLIYYLYDFPFTYSVDPMTKSITGSVSPVPRFTNLREAVIAALDQRALMERYAAVIAAQKHTLHALKHAFKEKEEQDKQDELNENEGREEQKKQVATLGALQEYQNLLHEYAYTDIKAQAYTQAHGPVWADPEAVYARLSELEAISPHQPLIQGALAEVLLQLKKPLQAQQHSDQAINAAPTLHPNEALEQSKKPDHNETSGHSETSGQTSAPGQNGASGKSEASGQSGEQNTGEIASQNATANNRPTGIPNAIFGEYAYLYDTRGEIFLQLNLPTLATENFTKAIELDGHNPLFFLHRAASYLPRNKTAAMCNDFSQACILGDCSGYQWAVDQQLCVQESPVQELPAQESPVQGLLQTPLAQVPKP